ncbi:hypothetical protein LVD17_01245 [Fulvivirga ulvae]|uniref:hypothetical protein n=1 Tax=Fulvivirga ulvae TaxID=2904245 RepID=UPI001F316B1B|nr:hypothetical protein [Fulvivirga ulvae]UII32464.1 hypothetical protein LVD17_01245 [Fulvivirga ulvae]
MMKNKKGKSGYLILLIIPVVVGFMTLMGKLAKDVDEEVDKFGVETVGELL